MESPTPLCQIQTDIYSRGDNVRGDNVRFPPPQTQPRHHAFTRIHSHSQQASIVTPHTTASLLPSEDTSKKYPSKVLRRRYNRSTSLTVRWYIQLICDANGQLQHYLDFTTQYTVELRGYRSLFRPPLFHKIPTESSTSTPVLDTRNSFKALTKNTNTNPNPNPTPNPVADLGARIIPAVDTL